jgi:anaerobic selenocysteine-containing dehydrogenase
MSTDTDVTPTRKAYRTCPLCEAGCGLEITLEVPPQGDRVKRIRGDRDDVFSGGFICPKGSTLGHLHDDPDRLRKPVVKRDGEFVEVEWDEAFATIDAGLMPLLEAHGRDACAIYLGNPSAHSLGPLLYNRALITSLGTRNRFSASTVDQRPKELRTGPFGDGFGADPDGLTLATLEANPHGVDLGALVPDRVPDLLRTPSGKIEALPDQMRTDLERLAASLDRDWDHSMVLVGRRHVRSNNSWMHNVTVLTKGRNRCTMQIHPDDADRLGLSEGSAAKVASRVGEVAIDVEITDGIRPGVVSIPHGFGQNMPGVQLRVAQEYRGVNTNVLTDEQFYDLVSGNIALNGVPVTVTAIA